MTTSTSEATALEMDAFVDSTALADEQKHTSRLRPSAEMSSFQARGVVVMLFSSGISLMNAL
jgi:hypothetical protein